MKLIVGLGNPGSSYVNTRHNVGFCVVDYLADKNGGSFKENKKFSAYECFLNINGERVILIKPTTFMNLSGNAVLKYVNFYHIDLGDLLVIHDDLDMVLGKIRIVFDSSSGGHNGINDIISKIGSKKFTRLKIGISNDKSIDTKDFVLGKFNDNEISVLDNSYHKLDNLISDFISYDVAMLKQIYNSKNN